jgi:hypothetical protein
MTAHGGEKPSHETILIYPSQGVEWGGGERNKGRYEQYIFSKNAVFWNVKSRGSCKNRRFGGKYRLHHQDEKIGELEPHSVTSQKTELFLVTGVKTSNLTIHILRRYNKD